MKTFNNWLKTFINEKGLDLEKPVNVLVEDSFYGEVIGMTYQDVVDLINSASENEKAQIKHKLIMIDFKSGNLIEIEKFLDFLANCYLKTCNEKREA